jgi:hypothetical protein
LGAVCHPQFLPMFAVVGREKEQVVDLQHGYICVQPVGNTSVDVFEEESAGISIICHPSFCT